MLEYGYMLALNKPPALVRMDPYSRPGDDSSVWENHACEDGSQIYVPCDGLDFFLKLQKLKLKRLKVLTAEADVYTSRRSSYLTRIPRHCDPEDFLATQRSNLILGAALRAPEAIELQEQAGLRLSTPKYVGQLVTDDIGSQRMWMTDYGPTHINPESRKYSIDHEKTYWRSLELAHLALILYVPKPPEGSSDPVSIDSGDGNFLIQKNLSNGGGNSVVIIDAQGDPGNLGQLSPQDISG